MADDGGKESEIANIANLERKRLIKEERRKQHEQRLTRAALAASTDIHDSNTLKRFSKYRRSSRKLQEGESSECSPPSSIEIDNEELGRNANVALPKKQSSNDLESNASSRCELPQSSDVQAAKTDVIATSAVEDEDGSATRVNSASGNGLPGSISLDQSSKSVLRKPLVPRILRSATEPSTSCVTSDEDSSGLALKKPSILKKKDDSSSANPSSSNVASTHVQSVSFGLPVSTTLISRTKSIDSNISGDTETGYWSGGENSGGILKHRKSVDSDLTDISGNQNRRSSLGNSSSASEGGLHSILKRKLSYDGSRAVGKDSNSSEYSFSTRSLPSCGCLSPEPKPILKKKSSSEDLEEVEPKPILKKGSRDSQDLSVETERIKPCLKKSWSKSTDDGFPSSSSLNLSCGSSYSSSVSPINCISNASESSASLGSGCKGILKRGDGRHSWRESVSASTSSASFDVDNPGDEEENVAKHENSALHAARRQCASEGDIHSGQTDVSLCSGDNGSNFRIEGNGDQWSSDNNADDGANVNSEKMLSPEEESPKEIVPRGKIAEKIAALQSSGEVEWKKRVGKVNDKDNNNSPASGDNNVQLRSKSNKELKSNLVANRLSQLEVSQDSWKKRVGETDAGLFTVQGKLEKAGIKSVPKPISAEVKEKLQKVVIPANLRQRAGKDDTTESKSKTDSQQGESGPEPLPAFSPSSPPKETLAEKRRKLLHPGKSVSNGSNDSGDEEKVTRLVPRNDDEAFATFFATVNSKSSSDSLEDKYIVDDSAFEAVEANREKLIGVPKKIRAPRNHTSKSNPVKALAQRLEEQRYEELSPQVREKLKLQGENMSKHAHFADEAKAGLASKEDFTAVKLKKAGTQEPLKPEYPSQILIKVKGKRQVQCRVVPPELKSLNSGDIFVLVTPRKVYQFIGEYSNRLERNRVKEMVNSIVQRKDLGFKGSSYSDIATLEECYLTKKLLSRDGEKFLELLGGGELAESGDLGDESDEIYETSIVKTNKVYEMDEAKEELVPLTDSVGWESQPRYSILDESKVLIFDFGTEMYVWSGAKADSDVKKTAHRLATNLFELGYDYENLVDQEFNPIGGPLKASRRPDWCFIKRAKQNIEPVLFMEKFFDWPDDSGKLIKALQQRKPQNLAYSREGSYSYECCDVEEMLEHLGDIPDPDLELEFFNVGRGTTVRNEEEYRRTFIINTASVKAWNMSECSKSNVDETNMGQFYSGETYVIHWQFSATQTGRDLKGGASKHGGILGRERNTYFYWHGKDSKITEQGTSALMTVEMDREKGPQVRLEQGLEPPAFLNLFEGLMFIHLGTKETALRDTKLYVACGALPSEGHFVEIPSEVSAFRSLGSYLLVDLLKGRLYLWHGCLSNDVCRQIAKHGAEKAVEDSARYLNYHGSLRLIMVEEGEETAAFKCCVKMHTGKELGDSLLSLKGQCWENYADYKAFTFTSLRGVFEAEPWVSVKRKSGSPEAFPMWQDDLYTASQPQLFQITRGGTTWLWQGWVPQGDGENDNTATGSGEIRWAQERKAALETVLKFSSKLGTESYLVFAGYEPKSFQNLFPAWQDSLEAFDANKAEGRELGMMVPVEEALSKFQRTTYTIEELQEKPEGVDQSRLESYLNDQDFENTLKMSRDEFNDLQAWKKLELKKAVGLF